jgi:hypothetical protein
MHDTSSLNTNERQTHEPYSWLSLSTRRKPFCCNTDNSSISLLQRSIDVLLVVVLLGLRSVGLTKRVNNNMAVAVVGWPAASCGWGWEEVGAKILALWRYCTKRQVNK